MGQSNHDLKKKKMEFKRNEEKKATTNAKMEKYEIQSMLLNASCAVQTLQ